MRLTWVWARAVTRCSTMPSISERVRSSTSAWLRIPETIAYSRSAAITARVQAPANAAKAVWMDLNMCGTPIAQRIRRLSAGFATTAAVRSVA